MLYKIRATTEYRAFYGDRLALSGSCRRRDNAFGLVVCRWWHYGVLCVYCVAIDCRSYGKPAALVRHLSAHRSVRGIVHACAGHRGVRLRIGKAEPLPDALSANAAPMSCASGGACSRWLHVARALRRIEPVPAGRFVRSTASEVWRHGLMLVLSREFIGVSACMCTQTRRLWPCAFIHAGFDVLYLAPNVLLTGTMPETYASGAVGDTVLLAVSVLMLSGIVYENSQRNCVIALAYIRLKRVIYISALRNQAPIRGRGGIGRRVRFRSVWGQPHGGSSPLARTIRNRKTRFGGSFCVLE